jgi:hypothetical protein
MKIIFPAVLCGLLIAGAQAKLSRTIPARRTPKSSVRTKTQVVPLQTTARAWIASSRVRSRCRIALMRRGSKGSKNKSEIELKYSEKLQCVNLHYASWTAWF